jgi:hypothetical protein
MFRLLCHLGFDTVMLWPVVEAIPMPLSAGDRADLLSFRRTITDAQACGLRCWLTQCAALGCDPSIGERPWLQRNFYPARRVMRLDDPATRSAWLAHRAAIMAELNNADAYVTIDGDPGSYPDAAPADFVDVFRADRSTLAAVGTHPDRQMVIPWLWSGWGRPVMNSFWSVDPAPFLHAEAQALAAARAELAPFAVLPGRHANPERHNRRCSLEATAAAGLGSDAVTFLYEAIECEPVPPVVEPAFARIRAMMRQEAAGIAAGRGVFGNAQQPLLQLPNLWFFARAARDTAYLDQADEQVLADLAAFLGGDPALLLPAWRSLESGLAELPARLPSALRAARLGPAADDLPGGATRYVDLLARQVECRRAVLTACAQAPADDADAVARGVAASAAIVAWWQDNRYVFDGAEERRFRWHHVHPRLRRELDAWIAEHRRRLLPLRGTIAAALVQHGLDAPGEAEARVGEAIAP